MKNYHTYLFDLDGTLITTIDLICNCFQFSLKKHLGHEFSRKDILLQIGLPLKQQFAYFIKSIGKEAGEFDQFDLETMARDHMDYQLQIWRDHVQAYPEARDLLSSLKAAGKKVGIVTSRLSQTAGLYLEHTGLSPYVDCLITPEATEKHKPHPDPVTFALKQLQGEVGTCVMIGDSLFDIQSGAAAGVDTVWVVHPDSPWLETMEGKKDTTLEQMEPALLATLTLTELRGLLPPPLKN